MICVIYPTKYADILIVFCFVLLWLDCCLLYIYMIHLHIFFITLPPAIDELCGKYIIVAQPGKLP